VDAHCEEGKFEKITVKHLTNEAGVLVFVPVKNCGGQAVSKTWLVRW